jgi:hypothetical protein
MALLFSMQELNAAACIDLIKRAGLGRWWGGFTTPPVQSLLSLPRTSLADLRVP